jgi:uncharacterized protein (DUF58 family)
VGDYRFVDPRTLASLGDLELAARLVVDGFMIGAHRSRKPGAGLEFSQFRSYQPGDDLRRVDWKLFGRSDRYFVRESESETSLTVRLVLDASASMAQAEDGLSKFDYARYLAAALAVLARRQGDAVGLYALADAHLILLPASRESQHLHRLLHALEGLEPGGVWPAWPSVERALLAGAGRGITVIVTDLHERRDEIRDTARRLAALQHDVLVCHLIGRAEYELAFPGTVTFEELETGRRVDVDADAARGAYRAALDAELEGLRVELEDRRISYGRFFLDQPLDGPLRAFLTGRARLSY